MRNFSVFYRNQQIVPLRGSADFDSQDIEIGDGKVLIPDIRLCLTSPGQTPAQYAECFGYQLVPPQAWQPEHMRAAQALVDGGVAPNRIALFVVPGGVP